MFFHENSHFLFLQPLDHIQDQVLSKSSAIFLQPNLHHPLSCDDGVQKQDADWVFGI